MTTATGFGSVHDLRQALRAMRSERPRPGASAPPPPSRWVPAPGERALLVCGCGGSAGASTVALALAAAAGAARVVEACGGPTSGLVYAADAELGTAEHGWQRGARDAVVVERRTDLIGSPRDLPTPAGGTMPLTVVDSSWEVATVLGSSGWLGDLARSVPAVVLVTRASVPGLRRLEAALGLVGVARSVAVSVGARRWPRPVEQSAGAATRRLAADGRVIHIPQIPPLALFGLTPDPLPPAVIRPAVALLTLLEGLQP